MKNAIRIKHYSLQTEQSYIQWVRRYIYFHNKRHPDEMGSLDVQKFLSYIAVDQHVSVSTQNQVRLHSRAATKLRPGTEWYCFSL
ncbi:MAG: phage integrase N-terminal SAM-like domain-containing protein [Spirochaetia bacterium]|nr:phage integrase N-terminal SAM-like domain-containing protein [Spirochaetia bacterium]